MGRTRFPSAGYGGAALLALLTCGFAISDQQLGAYVGDRATYEGYSCTQRAAQETAFKTRIEELDGLMAKAARDTGGSVVNAVAYRPESITAHGSLDAVRRVQAEKNCPPPAPPATAPAAPAKRAR